jgi:hypothetical protein
LYPARAKTRLGSYILPAKAFLPFNAYSGPYPITIRMKVEEIEIKSKGGKWILKNRKDI